MTGAVEASAFAALDRRLDAGSTRPLAVAVSGGGDSVALLHLADVWARRAGRPLHVLTVDHGLNPESPRWTRFVADAAARLGRSVDTLAWRGEKPAAGLPAAARSARHALLAEAARRLGARVVLAGHTADDELEGELMRAEGSTLGALREWTPSPAWPEGRGVFLLRPLLEVRRAALRRWLTERALGWIEDPANDDPRFARTRARRRLSSRPPGSPGPGALRPINAGASSGTTGEGEAFGAVCLDRASSVEDGVLGPALLCASGGTRPPRGHRLSVLAARLRSGAPVSSTLAGARVEADAARAVIGRNAGERARGGLAALAVEPGVPAVWDGRFEVNADVRGTLRPLAGRAARLAPAERAGLKAAPAWLRPALPVIEARSGAVFCPLLSHPPQARSLVGARLRAACGEFTCEREIPG